MGCSRSVRTGAAPFSTPRTQRARRRRWMKPPGTGATTSAYAPWARWEADDACGYRWSTRDPVPGPPGSRPSLRSQPPMVGGVGRGHRLSGRPGAGLPTGTRASSPSPGKHLTEHRCRMTRSPARLIPASPGDCRCPGPNPGTSLGGAALAPGRAASTAMSHRSTPLTRRRPVSRSLRTVFLGNPMRPARQLPLPRPSRQAIEALAVLMYVLLLPTVLPLALLGTMIALSWWEDRPLVGGVEAHWTVRRSTARSTRRRALFLPASDSQGSERDHTALTPLKRAPASGLGSNGRARAPRRTRRPLKEENEA